MRRIKDEFLSKTEAVVPLTEAHVLEIGCGNGSRSVAIAEHCARLTAIEPDAALVAKAHEASGATNIQYFQGCAEELPFADHIFNVILFTLSLHHVPQEKTRQAINEAIRVVKEGGHIVFLEPTHTGTFFEAELLFDAGGGDERIEKAHAYCEMLQTKNWVEQAEIQDETIFAFESKADYITSMEPKKNLAQLDEFLLKHDYALNAHRRINIFQTLPQTD